MVNIKVPLMYVHCFHMNALLLGIGFVSEYRHYICCSLSWSV
jgi:hypothetical protein